jgi:Zn-dependent protease
MQRGETVSVWVFLPSLLAAAGVRLAGYLFILPIFLISLTIHEYAHAWMAYRYGDDTAKRMGRLTLNPFAHISLIGTIILPLLVHFGWAKPIPVNFSILTKKQIFKVAVAGPLANILLAFILAGSFHLFHLEALSALGNFVLHGILVNLFLAVFNLLPLPPLDGSKMVYAFLKSHRAMHRYAEFAPFGTLILIGLLLSGWLQKLILPLTALLYILLRLPLSALTIKRTEKKEGRKIEPSPLKISTLGQMLEENARKFGKRIAIRFHDELISYKELNEKVNRFANSLIKLGVKKRDKIGIILHNSPEFIITSFALFKIGAIAVPINLSWKPEEISEKDISEELRKISFDTENFNRILERWLMVRQLLQEAKEKVSEPKNKPAQTSPCDGRTNSPEGGMATIEQVQRWIEAGDIPSLASHLCRGLWGIPTKAQRQHLKAIVRELSDKKPGDVLEEKLIELILRLKGLKEEEIGKQAYEHAQKVLDILKK